MSKPIVTVINDKAVVEVIGRLKGRATSHKNAAAQTNCEKKKLAHLSAYEDLMSLCQDLAESTDNPELAKSNKAYAWAVSKDK
jgi:hypothetical protein